MHAKHDTDRTRATLLNTVEAHPAKASIDVNRPATTGDLAPQAAAVSIFFAAIADAGLSDKEAAYTMAMDPAQLSRVKSGQARLPFDAMWRLPNAFWFALRERIDEAKRLTDENARQLRARRIGELVKLLVEVA